MMQMNEFTAVMIPGDVGSRYARFGRAYGRRIG